MMAASSHHALSPLLDACLHVDLVHIPVLDDFVQGGLQVANHRLIGGVLQGKLRCSTAVHDGQYIRYIVRMPGSQRQLQ